MSLIKFLTDHCVTRKNFTLKGSFGRKELPESHSFLGGKPCEVIEFLLGSWELMKRIQGFDVVIQTMNLSQGDVVSNCVNL